MADDVFRKLARRLDAIPNGFPASQSGVELRLLAKIFTPEEAALASVMRLTVDPADEIASRAGVDERDANRLLRGMVRNGLIRIKKGKGCLNFGLMPFVVGIFEEQLPKMDEELAGLFEQYYQENHKEIFQNGPSVHRIIPVDKAIHFELEIFHYEQAAELLEGAKSWGVRDCICRVQQNLIGKGCDHEVENCLLLAPIEGAFKNSRVTHSINKEESLGILGEAVDAGLVHCTANHCSPIYYICNCCVCCCGVLRGLTEFGIPAAITRSAFRASLDSESCAGCGDCVEGCLFGALSVPKDVCVIDNARCVGCGLCTTACSTGAMRLERRSEGEEDKPAADLKEWMARRAENRGISMSEIQ